MKNLKLQTRVFFDLFVVPLIVVFIVVLAFFALIHYKHSFLSSFPRAVKFTQYLIIIVAIIFIYYWVNRVFKLPTSKIIHRILKILFTIIYGPIAFLMYWGVAVISLGIIYLFNKTKMNIFYFMLYYIGAIICFASGAIAIIRGKNLLKLIEDGVGKFVVFNHASFIDYILIVLIMGYKQKWKVVIGNNLLKYWPFNKYAKKIGIFISRESEGSGPVVLEKMIQATKDGYNVAVFPSAGRDRPNEIRNFRKGTFAAALKYDIPIFLVSLHDTDKYCPAGPRSKNSSGRVPKKFLPLLKYRLKSGLDVLKLWFTGNGDHLLVSPRVLKLKVLGELSLLDKNDIKKGDVELTKEAHYRIYKDLGKLN